MSDPVNPSEQQASTNQGPQSFGQQSNEQANFGQPAYGQPAYGQPAYGQPMYAVNPAAEKIRSNASIVRLVSFLSFLVVGPILAGAMWMWAGNLLQEAQRIGAPQDVVNEVTSARSVAKICTLIQVGIAVFLIVLMIVVAVVVGVTS